MEIMKIVFIYNSNSGIANSLLDIGHKILSPNSYECNLCSITFGLLTEKEEWKKFRESVNYKLEFLHEDEFENKYADKREYPIILRLNDTNEFIEILGKDDINEIKSVEELIRKLDLLFV